MNALREHIHNNMAANFFQNVRISDSLNLLHLVTQYADFVHLVYRLADVDR